MAFTSSRWGRLGFEIDLAADMNARRTLLVTGGNGFVAGSVLAQAGSEWEVHALSRGEEPAWREDFRWHICDSLAPGKLDKLFLEIRPHGVIHTAAIADIDFCQANPQMARAVNVDLSRRLTDLCGQTGARLVYCSTDTVFDGEHAPYDEKALPAPVNLYGETKVEAEQIVARLGTQALIARLSLVIGLPVFGAGNSSLARMLASLKAGRSIGVPPTEVRTPADVITLGRALLELVGSTHHGIFHLAGLTRLNRLELGQIIAARFGFSKHLVTAQPPASLPGRAARPRDVSLSAKRAKSELKTPLRTLEEGLSLILQTAAAKG